MSLALLLLFLPPQCDAWPQKPAWEWTIEERLAHRFDYDCFRARKATATHCSASGHVTDFVSGNDTPELFLPHQLFDHFVYQAFVSDHREIVLHRAKEAGVHLPITFFDTVEAAAGDYVRHPGDCAKRNAALARVRAAFGGNVFDRFLYTVIAPGLCSAGDDTRAMLLRQASCATAR